MSSNTNQLPNQRCSSSNASGTNLVPRTPSPRTPWRQVSQRFDDIGHRDYVEVAAGWLGLPPVRSDDAVRKRLAATRWVGAGATVLLAVITCGQPIPLSIVVVVGLVAMAALVGSWLVLGTVAGAASTRKLYTIAACWLLPLALARPLFSGDLWSYQAQGLISFSGGDPYRLGPAQALAPDSAVAQQVSHYWANTPAPYGPAWEGMAAVVARVTGSSLVAGVLAYRTLALAGILLIAWALPRLVRRSGTSQPVAVWLCLCNPLLLWHLISGAHNDAVMLGLVLPGFELGLAGLARGGRGGVARVAAGFVLLILAVNVKVVAIGAVCCLAAYAARRYGRVMPVVAAVTVGGVALSTVLAFGCGLGFGWIDALRSSTSVFSWMAPSNVLGVVVAAIAKLCGWSVLAGGAMRVVVLLGLLLGAVLGARVLLLIHRGEVPPLRGLALVLTITLVCGPVVQPWYMLWAILPLAMDARTVRRRNQLVVFTAVAALILPPAGVGVRVLILGYVTAALLVAVLWWWLRAVQLARPEWPAAQTATEDRYDRIS